VLLWRGALESVSPPAGVELVSGELEDLGCAMIVALSPWGMLGGGDECWGYSLPLVFAVM
jgi:hypothetical protein